MRASQESFGFDVFEAAGWTHATVEDFEAREARERVKAEWDRRQKQEREDREAQARQERRERARREYAAGQRGYESPWDILGVRMGASKAEARAAWVRLCKRFHPDAGGSAEDMKRVNNAWNSVKGQAR